MDAIRVAKVDNVRLELIHGAKKEDLNGTLHLTAHHLLFCADGHPENWTPYPLINQATRLPQTLLGISPLLIRTRTFQALLFSFPKGSDRDADEVYLSIRELTVANSLEQLYAFYYQPSPPLYDQAGPGNIGPGWTIYNPREEFARMGVGSRTKAWRFTDINRDYQFSPTYPSKLVVPAKISDAVLAYAAKYRSKARIPALTYLHWANHASITRCSQPLVGIKQARSAQDERLVDSIFQSHMSPETSYSPPVYDLTASPTPTRTPQPSGTSTPSVYGATTTNLIVDARSTTNAVANVTRGAGTENMENYKGGKKTYLGVENIHVMRNSLNRLTEVLRDSEPVSGSQSIGGGSMGVPTGFIDRIALRRSNWLKHISALLDGTLIIVKNVHVNSSHVLIHCSDGWDRTSQLAALAELCLDPYYRTFKGFAVLVEKDFLAFGHKFLDRCGHLSPDKLNIAQDKDEEGENAPGGAERAAQAFIGAFQKQFQSSHHEKEISPVFHQFLDCVRQLQRQFPERFEFNSDFLTALHYQLYACQYGTFLFNTEKQRRTIAVLGDDESGISAAKAAPWERTVSVWDYLAQPSERAKHLNEQFDPSLDDPKRGPEADMGVLFPRPKEVKYWHELFGRTDEELNGRIVLEQQGQGVDVLGPIGTAEADPAVQPFPATMAKAAIDVATQPQIPRTGQADWVASTAPEGTAGDSYGDDMRSSSRSSGYNSEKNAVLNPYGPNSRSPIRARGSRNSPLSSSTSSTGWGWSQLGSGALSAMNVIQGAAREVKSIGADALAKLTAEGQTQEPGEMWTKSSVDGPDSASGASPPSRTTAAASNPWAKPRLPFETNPWSSPPVTEPAAERQPIEPNTFETAKPLQAQPDSPPPPPLIPQAYQGPAGLDYLAPSTATWGSTAERGQSERTSISPSSSATLPYRRPLPPSRAESPQLGLECLTLGPTVSSRTDTPAPMPPVEPESRKSWDPLGVL